MGMLFLQACIKTHARLLRTHAVIDLIWTHAYGCILILSMLCISRHGLCELLRQSLRRLKIDAEHLIAILPLTARVF